MKIESLVEIRDFIKKKRAGDKYWRVANYDFHLPPEDFLEELIVKGKDMTITELENLSENQKGALANIILGLVSLTEIHASF